MFGWGVEELSGTLDMFLIRGRLPLCLPPFWHRLRWGHNSALPWKVWVEPSKVGYDQGWDQARTKSARMEGLGKYFSAKKSKSGFCLWTFPPGWRETGNPGDCLDFGQQRAGWGSNSFEGLKSRESIFAYFGLTGNRPQFSPRFFDLRLVCVQGCGGWVGAFWVLACV